MTPARILVVDNEEDQLELLQSVLTRMGHRVDVAVTGERALSHLRRCPVDIVFTDLIMPGMDGMELCEEIRRLAPDTRVVAVSGHLHLYEADRLKRIGFDGTVCKPYRLDDIETQTRRMLTQGVPAAGGSPHDKAPS